MSLSPNVKKVAKQNVKAKEAIQTLQDSLTADDSVNAALFNNKVSGTLAEMKVTDADLADESSYIRVEYTAEFSLDDIANVIKDVLKVVAANSGPGVPGPATSPEAIEAYMGVVSSVAEAAKTSSASSSDMSYSATKIGPGTYVFLFARSASISDERLFGTESITASALYYRVINSIQAVQKSAEFKLALIDYYMIDKWALVKESYIDLLIAQQVDANTCRKMQEYADEEMRKARVRLKQAGLPVKQPMLMTAAPDEDRVLLPSLQDRIAQAQEASKAKLALLAERGGDDAAFAKETAERLDAATE